jgi:hypothetical protein
VAALRLPDPLLLCLVRVGLRRPLAGTQRPKAVVSFEDAGMLTSGSGGRRQMEVRAGTIQKSLVVTSVCAAKHSGPSTRGIRTACNSSA